MSERASIVFPNQLFRQHPALHPGGIVYLVEEWLYFHQYNFHQQKLLLHRATMRMYADYLSEQGYQVRYISATSAECDVQKLPGLPVLDPRRFGARFFKSIDRPS